MRSLKVRRLVLVLIAVVGAACGSADQAPALKEVQRVRSGMLDVVLLSSTGTLSQGQSSFVLEFRSADGQLADVGSVTINATMAMAGMAPMFGESVVTPSGTSGRYEVTSDLSMAGAWRFSIAWDGPAGRGSASLPGTVL